MIKNIFKILSFVLCISACINEVPVYAPQAAAPGDAVQFVAGLNLTDTKTIYGEEVMTNGVATAVKVNWVQNDLVSVYGTNALEGRQQGTYKVTAETGSPYAGTLQMQGDHGVQWGADASRFYAVYPSSTGAFEPAENGDVKVPMTINAVQSNFFTYSSGVWRGTQGTSPDDNTMVDALMYACSDGELATGSTVSLQFKPFATVLKFSLDGVQTENGENTQTKVYINEIQVIAPSGNICGTFPMTITADAKASADVTTSKMTNPSNKIIVKPYSDSYANPGSVDNSIYVAAGDKIEFSVFTIPQPNINLNGWKVTVVTSHGTRTFTISTSTEAAAQLVAGQMHKVNIPCLANLEEDFKFNPEEWIAQLPTDVLLSELSIPGAWYSTNPEVNKAGVGYQNSIVVTDDDGVEYRQTNLEEMYRHGIRAFNIDSRLSIYEGSNSDTFDNKYSMDDYTNGNLVLACAGTEVEEVNITDFWFTQIETPTGKMNKLKTVKSALEELGALITNDSNKDEFIVVVITVSDKAKTHTPKTYGTIDSQMMLRAIADVLNHSDVYKYLYTGKITEKTTLNDVIGKIIVKVNINDSDFTNQSNTVANKYTEYDAPMMVTYAPMSTSYTNKPIVSGIDYSVNDNLHYYACQNQGTNSSGYNARRNAITAIANFAFDNYTPNQNDDQADMKKHAWYQLGIGGYSASNESNVNAYTEVCDELNTHVLTIVQNRLQSRNYAPVGIVLMNQVTYQNSQTLTNAILTLNARMKLEHASGGN